MPKPRKHRRTAGNENRRAPVSSPKLRWIFRVVAVLLPVIVLPGLEFLARQQGFGGYPPVLVHSGNDGRHNWYSTYRPGVDSFFDTRKSHTGGMRTTSFTTPKPPGTRRIVLLGGSAMQGYPQERALTDGEFLRAMLADCWHGSNQVEVLNLGATAMASFPVANFLEAMLPHEPDLVVVMSGNNEFYGAYGVSSLHSAGTSPAGMRFTRWVRSLGLAQWLSAKLAKPLDEKQLAGKPLMQVVVAKNQVAPEDPLRAAAKRCLQANLIRMVRLCRERNVPLILCTLPTNERLAPVGEDIAPRLPPEELRQFTNLLAEAKATLTNAPSVAVQKAGDALSLNARSARGHFLLAEAKSAAGDNTGALAAYVAARDLDTMPWRATSAANEAVRAAAQTGALLCDMEGAFRAQSPGGIIGWELMDDHVHMSVEGQALFARTLVQAMTNQAGELRVDPSHLAQLPDNEHYARQLGRSACTDYVVASRMRSIFEIPFMTNSNPQAAQRWRARADALANAMTELDRNALEHWKDPELHVSDHRPLTGVVGYYRMMNDDPAGAAELFRVARESVPNVSLWRLQFTWYLVRCERERKGGLDHADISLCREGIEVGRLLERFVGFRDPMGPSFLGMCYHAAGDYRSAIKYLDDPVRYASGKEGADVVYALADSLVQENQRDRAELLLNLARRDPAMKPKAEQWLQAWGMTVREAY